MEVKPSNARTVYCHPKYKSCFADGHPGRNFSKEECQILYAIDRFLCCYGEFDNLHVLPERMSSATLNMIIKDRRTTTGCQWEESEESMYRKDPKCEKLVDHLRKDELPDDVKEWVDRIKDNPVRGIKIAKAAMKTWVRNNGPDIRL